MWGPLYCGFCHWFLYSHPSRFIHSNKQIQYIIVIVHKYKNIKNIFHQYLGIFMRKNHRIKKLEKNWKGKSNKRLQPQQYDFHLQENAKTQEAKTILQYISQGDQFSQSQIIKPGITVDSWQDSDALADKKYSNYSQTIQHKQNLNNKTQKSPNIILGNKSQIFIINQPAQKKVEEEKWTKTTSKSMCCLKNTIRENYHKKVFYMNKPKERKLKIERSFVKESYNRWIKGIKWRRKNPEEKNNKSSQVLAGRGYLEHLFQRYKQEKEQQNRKMSKIHQQKSNEKMSMFKRQLERKNKPKRKNGLTLSKLQVNSLSEGTNMKKSLIQKEKLLKICAIQRNL